MDDGNIPKQFQKISMHGFQEINPHHLQPFFIFLEIHASIAQVFFYEEVHNDDGNMLRKFQVNPVYCLGDMDKTSLLQEVVLVVFKRK